MLQARSGLGEQSPFFEQHLSSQISIANRASQAEKHMGKHKDSELSRLGADQHER